MMRAWLIQFQGEDNQYVFMDQSGFLDKNKVKEQVLLTICPDQYMEHDTLHATMTAEKLEVFQHVVKLKGRVVYGVVS